MSTFAVLLIVIGVFAAFCVGMWVLFAGVDSGPGFLARRYFFPNAEDEITDEVVGLLDDDGEAWVRQPASFRDPFDIFITRLNLVRGDMQIVASPDVLWFSVLRAIVSTRTGVVTLCAGNAQRVVDAIKRRDRRAADIVSEDVAVEVAP